MPTHHEGHSLSSIGIIQVGQLGHDAKGEAREVRVEGLHEHQAAAAALDAAQVPGRGGRRMAG